MGKRHLWIKKFESDFRRPTRLNFLCVFSNFKRTDSPIFFLPVETQIPEIHTRIRNFQYSNGFKHGQVTRKTSSAKKTTWQVWTGLWLMVLTCWRQTPRLTIPVTHKISPPLSKSDIIYTLQACYSLVTQVMTVAYCFQSILRHP